MRLVFSNADEDTLDRYRELLPRSAAAWARAAGAPVATRVLAAVVGYKLGEPRAGGDGLVARWSAADAPALRHWLATREDLSPADTAAVPRALTTWWSFLADRGWTDPRSLPLDRFLAAYAAAHAAAPPPRRPDYRCGSAPAPASARPGIGERAPAAPPRGATRRGAPGLTFAAFAAARSGARPAPAAPAAGWGRLGATLPAVPLPGPEAFTAGVLAAPAVAAASGTRGVAAALDLWWARFTDLRRRVAACVGPRAAEPLVGAVLTALCLGRDLGTPMPVVAHMAAAAPEVRAAEPRPAADLAARAADVLTELTALGAVAESAGAGGRHAVLTDVGRWLWYALLCAGGVRPRSHAELMAEDAEVVVDRAAAGDPCGAEELRRWIAARGAPDAMRALVALYRRSDDCVHRSVARAATAAHPLAARPCYEALRDDPGFGARARAWLFDAGFAKQDALDPDDHLAPLLDGLAASLRQGTYGNDDEGSYLSVSEPELPGVFDTAAGCGHPESPFVLAWFAQHHPDRRIRAAARSARAALVRQRAG
ncbi:hypothetical protein LG943_02005 [Streptomonospora sp. S1-112]|uniref:Uncharacterized protein n=1 Tax=Streptomonospora mangrovi TaxID=2883123 RepID=A0A9X3NHA5_9ACTN|nr:hypothetical protein [Streptomonospora mangrovi]MDA0563108.1 hypothetical protein [Streptomonospora mangrovi]